MTNKFFNKEEVKSWAYFLLQNIDQLEGYDPSNLIYNNTTIYDPDKDLIVLMFAVRNSRLEGELYLTFSRSRLYEIKRMPNDEAFFNGNIGFGFIPNLMN